MLLLFSMSLLLCTGIFFFAKMRDIALHGDPHGLDTYAHAWFAEDMDEAE